MSQELKCPFCGTELKPHGNYGMFCENPECWQTQTPMSIRLWEFLIDGKKAQDALKVAISALGLVGNGKSDEQGICRFVDERNIESVRDICRNALENIKTITKKGE